MFQKLAAFILCIFLFLGNAAAQSYDLSGIWERTGDAWKGMQVEVIYTETGYQAKVIQLPEHAKKWCFVLSDLKWKQIELSKEGSFIMDDLYIRRGQNYRYYKRTAGKFIDENSIQTKLFTPNREWIGITQKWIRKPIDKPAT